jgi:hypothetical protein
MLGEIRRMSTNEAQLPAEFEALRNENQALLDKVKNEVANQERYAEEIDRLRQETARLEKLAGTYASVESVRAGLFKDALIPLSANERGQFYLDGKLIPYPLLLSALAAPPVDETHGKSVPHRLSVKLPAGAKPTDDVFQFRLRQIASASDQIGLRHELFPQPPSKSGR